MLELSTTFSIRQSFVSIRFCAKRTVDRRDYQIPSNILAYGHQVTGAVLASRIATNCKNRDRHRPGGPCTAVLGLIAQTISNIHENATKFVLTGAVLSAAPVGVARRIFDDLLSSSREEKISNLRVCSKFGQNSIKHHAIFHVLPVRADTHISRST